MFFSLTLSCHWFFLCDWISGMFGIHPRWRLNPTPHSYVSLNTILARTEQNMKSWVISNFFPFKFSPVVPGLAQFRVTLLGGCVFRFIKTYFFGIFLDRNFEFHSRLDFLFQDSLSTTIKVEVAQSLQSFHRRATAILVLQFQITPAFTVWWSSLRVMHFHFPKEHRFSFVNFFWLSSGTHWLQCKGHARNCFLARGFEALSANASSHGGLDNSPFFPPRNAHFHSLPEQ